MAAVLFGFEDLLYSWDSLVWSLTSRALRTCRFGNLRVLQLMLKPWCISRAVYQVGLQNTRPDPKTLVLQRGKPPGSRTGSCLLPTNHFGSYHRWWDREDTVSRGGLGGETRVLRMVVGSSVAEHRSKLSFPQSRGAQVNAN